MTGEAAGTKSETPVTEADGHFGCVCGKIRVDVLIPSSSTFVAPPSALCQCRDCYRFASAVTQYRKEHCPNSSDQADGLTACNAVDMRQIYKSDALRLVGEEFLQGVKLSEESPCIRYYSTCCGTPLMMDYSMAPFLLVMQHTIDATVTNKFQRLPPSIVLNHKSAPADSPATPEGVPICDGVSFGFITRAVARAVFGMLYGKNTSSIAAQLAQVPIATGTVDTSSNVVLAMMDSS